MVLDSESSNLSTSSQALTAKLAVKEWFGICFDLGGKFSIYDPMVPNQELLTSSVHKHTASASVHFKNCHCDPLRFNDVSFYLVSNKHLNLTTLKIFTPRVSGFMIKQFNLSSNIFRESSTHQS